MVIFNTKYLGLRNRLYSFPCDLRNGLKILRFCNQHHNQPQPPPHTPTPDLYIIYYHRKPTAEGGLRIPTYSGQHRLQRWLDIGQSE